MSFKSTLLKIKYYLFGKREEKFWELSELDPSRGMAMVQSDYKGKVYIRRKLTEYDIKKYKRLKKHPVDNTPKIYRLEEDEGVLTILEEFLRGDSLTFSLKKNGLMDENRVIDITRQLCTILNAYHNYNPPIAGHDLNPTNVKMNTNAVVSLIEYNVEKYNRPNAKVENLPEPERYTDAENPGVLSDVYGLGVLMNVLLTGKHPDEGIAPGSLEDVIRKCTSSNIAYRYQNVMDVSNDLKEIKRSLPFGKRLSSWRRYLIPGFRGKNAYLRFFALAAYPMLFYVGLVVKFDGGNTLGFLSRLLFCITVLATVLFDGNYLNVQKHIPLVRSRRRILRFLGMLLANALLLAILLASLNLFPAIINAF